MYKDKVYGVLITNSNRVEFLAHKEFCSMALFWKIKEARTFRKELIRGMPIDPKRIRVVKLKLTEEPK